MKTVNDIIWSKLVDDDTAITIFNFYGYALTSTCTTCKRYYEEIMNWGKNCIYAMHYFPESNVLYIYLYYCGRGIDHDPA